MWTKNKREFKKIEDMADNEVQKSRLDLMYRKWLNLKKQALSPLTLEAKNFFNGIFYQINNIIVSYKNIAESKIEENERQQNELANLKGKINELGEQFDQTLEERNERINELEQANKELKRRIPLAIENGRIDVMDELLEHFSKMQNIQLDSMELQEMKEEMGLAHEFLFASLKNKMDIECYQHERLEKMDTNETGVIIDKEILTDNKDLDGTVYKSQKMGCRINGKDVIPEKIVLYVYREKNPIEFDEQTIGDLVVSTEKDSNVSTNEDIEKGELKTCVNQQTEVELEAETVNEENSKEDE